MMEDIDLDKIVRIPMPYRICIWFVFLALIGVGCAASYSQSDWTWLSRMGSIIVIIPVIFEATGSIQRYIQRVSKLASEITGDVVRMQVVRMPYMYGLSGSETDKQVDQIAEKERRRRVKDSMNVMEKAISNNIRSIEFKIVAIGSLLWGFADLINKIYLK